MVGTVRRETDAEEFRALHTGRAIARILDVTDDEAVFATVNDIEATVGPIDIVIANAGYGHEGVFEEAPLTELRNQFAVNVFGAVATTQIHVTAVAPGSFRTDWAGRSMVRTERSIPDYDELMDPVRARRRAADGNQLGDPEKAAAAILSVIEEPDPPAHLILGSDALRLVRAGRAAVDAEIEKWADLSATTDFAEGAQLPG